MQRVFSKSSASTANSDHGQLVEGISSTYPDVFAFAHRMVVAMDTHTKWAKATVGVRSRRSRFFENRGIVARAEIMPLLVQNGGNSDLIEV